jgi:hypothetical protein
MFKNITVIAAYYRLFCFAYLNIIFLRGTIALFHGSGKTLYRGKYNCHQAHAN